MRPLQCIGRDNVSVARERQRWRESERVLSPAPQTCVTNPRGAGGKSVQDQSAAPQQGRSALSPFPHTFMNVHASLYCMCATMELEQKSLL